jgi:hypothetical protein
MLISTVLAAGAVLAGLMVVDWYVWDPRLRISNSLTLHPGDGKHQILRTAA